MYKRYCDCCRCEMKDREGFRIMVLDNAEDILRDEYDICDRCIKNVEMAIVEAFRVVQGAGVEADG